MAYTYDPSPYLKRPEGAAPSYQSRDPADPFSSDHPHVSQVDHNYRNEGYQETSTPYHEQIPHAQNVPNEYRQSDLVPQQYQDHGDIGQLFAFPNYPNPYEDEPSNLNRKPSSVGPWDSASQRSVPVDDSYSAQPLVPSDKNRHFHNKPSYAGGLSYIDEEGGYYRSDAQRPASAYNTDPTNEHRSREDLEMKGLMGGAAGMGGIEENRKFGEYEDGPSAYPMPTLDKGLAAYREPSSLYQWLLFPTGLDRLLSLFGLKAGKFPVQQAIERKRRGAGGQRWPIAAWTLTVGECR
jgi:hypothetical protein